LPEEYAPARLRFVSAPFANPASTAPGAEPLVFGVNITDLDRDGTADVLICDARLGVVSWARQRQGRWQETPVVQAQAPARVAVADLNRDGHLDMAIAVLGGIKPTDEPCGQLLLVLTDANNRWSMAKVLQDVARVADVQPVDLDGDGDLDLAVAMFGLYKTGGVGWLERQADGAYIMHHIFARTGCSHVVPLDLERDGRMDLIVLVSQEHEQVIALRNAGNGTFTPRPLFMAQSPMFGCAGLIAADLDRDDDPDLLFTNGDSLDIDPVAKHWHGVQWLENRGAGEFHYHDIWRFPGAYAAAAADLDADGDVDVVVTSMMNRWDEPGRQSIAWLENDGQQHFVPHALAASPTALVSLAVGDLNGDRRPDILAGSMYVMPPFRRIGRVNAWMNDGQ
jgi:hypothetical protein